LPISWLPPKGRLPAPFGLPWPDLLSGRSELTESALPLRLTSLTLLWLFAVVYAVVHLASWANVRYRLPVDAVLLIFASLALADLGGWLAARVTLIRCSAHSSIH
jgi:hypothetical protein